MEGYADGGFVSSQAGLEPHISINNEDKLV